MAPFLISLVGRAGVGKSTLVGALQERLGESHQVSIFASSKVGIRLILKYWPKWLAGFLAYRCIRKIFRPVFHKGVRDLRPSLINMVFLESVVRKEMPDLDFVIQDEVGIYHSYLSFAIRASGASRAKVSRFFQLSWFYKNQPDLLLICELDEEDRLTRRKGRESDADKIFFSSPEMTARFDCNAELAWQCLDEYLCGKESGAGPEVMRLDMSRSIHELVDQVMVRLGGGAI